jgi:hypothetical protein
MNKKIKTIVIDTLTQIQENEYMLDKKKPGHDKWRDYSVDIYTLITKLQQKGFECILIMGQPGTGKSSGMRTLKSGTNIWYNADNKNPVWEGGRTEYGTKIAPKSPFHVIPTSYEEIMNHISVGIEKDLFETTRYVFILGHTENYKEGEDTRMRLKTLGNLANKMQIEGKLETVLYSKVEMESGKQQYVLETQNNGYNTARSPMGLFDGKINNDYQLIVDKLETMS